MAGAGFKIWNTSDVVSAADFNTYIQEQTVGVFADASARNSAISSPTEGMVAYLKDSNLLTYYDGSSWATAIFGDITDLGANNWKIFASNGSGVITEIANGADGTALMGTGASSAPAFENITGLKGSADRVLFLNSAGEVSELAIGAAGTVLKSAGTTADPVWGSAGGNWAQIATGTQSAGTTTVLNLTSLSNYRSIRGFFTYPQAASGTSALNFTVNGLTGNYYRVMGGQKWLGNSASWSGVWTGTSGGISYNGYQAYVQFQIDFLAEGAGTASKGVVVGEFKTFSPLDQSNALNGALDITHFVYNEPIASDTGITALNVYMGASTAAVASGFPSYYIEGYTAT